MFAFDMFVNLFKIITAAKNTNLRHRATLVTIRSEFAASGLFLPFSFSTDSYLSLSL